QDRQIGLAPAFRLPMQNFRYRHPEVAKLPVLSRPIAEIISASRPRFGRRDKVRLDPEADVEVTALMVSAAPVLTFPPATAKVAIRLFSASFSSQRPDRRIPSSASGQPKLLVLH